MINARPDLMVMAGSIAANIDNHFPPEGATDRQALCLAEEVGEFIGAYRRANGMARRAGTVEEVEAELADVVITSYVTAYVLDVALPEPVRSPYPSLPDCEGVPALADVLTLGGKVGQFIDAYLHPVRTHSIGDKLTDVVRQAYVIASLLGIDLDAAIARKSEKIFTRGWKDAREMIECSNCGMVFDPIATRWLCPRENCRQKASCCEGAPLPPATDTDR